MATIKINPIKFLNNIPQFSGEYKDLENFITLIDRIQPILITYDEMSQSICLDIIKSRLNGKAREIIEINNHVKSWIEIKKILVNNFGDHLTLEELFDKLRSVSFKSNSIEFYNDLKHILRRLNLKTKFETRDEDSIQIINNNKKSALNIFKNKIPEPMRSILHCRNPLDLEKAMDILHEAGYAYYSSFGQHNKNIPNINKQNKYNNNNNYNNSNRFSNPNLPNLFQNNTSNNPNRSNNNNYRPQSNQFNNNNRFRPNFNPNYNQNRNSNYRNNNYNFPNNNNYNNHHNNNYNNNKNDYSKNPFLGNSNKQEHQNRDEPMQVDFAKKTKIKSEPPKKIQSENFQEEASGTAYLI